MTKENNDFFIGLATATSMIIWLLFCMEQTWNWEVIVIAILTISSTASTLSLFNIVSSVIGYRWEYRWQFLLWISMKRLIIILLPGSIIGNCLQYYA